MTPTTAHESFCLEHASHFVAVRGRTPANRTRREFPTLAVARAYAAAHGDGRTMIYAVTEHGNNAHIKNA